MSEKPNRWILQIVLVLAIASLIGVSIVIPLLGGVLDRDSGVTGNPVSGSPASPSAQQAELEAQVKGYQLVLQREPDNEIALQGLVDAQLGLARLKVQQDDLKLEDLKATIPSLEKIAALKPQETRYGVLLAQYKQYIGDREGAAQAYRTILAAKPGDLLALQGLVGLLLEQNRPEAAIGLLNDTLKTAPQANQVQPGSVDTVSVQLILGQVYEIQKRYEEAVSIYDEAIKTAPQDFRPLLGKALVLKEQGQLDEAKSLFTTATALAPAQYRDQINQLASGKDPKQASVKPEPAGTITDPSKNPIGGSGLTGDDDLKPPIPSPDKPVE